MAIGLFLGSAAAMASAAAGDPQTVASVPVPSSACRTSAASVQALSKPEEGRRHLMTRLAVLLLGATTSAAGNANATLLEDLLAKTAANKELNDRKRLATSGANTARAYTVTFGTCKFPENFTGCQDLAKKKNVPFLSDDLKLECEGKEKHKCGSNVFWKW